MIVCQSDIDQYYSNMIYYLECFNSPSQTRDSALNWNPLGQRPLFGFSGLAPLLSNQIKQNIQKVEEWNLIVRVQLN